MTPSSPVDGSDIPEPRPRPSWGQPAPDPSESSPPLPEPSEAYGYGQPGQQPYGTPSETYGSSTDPYASGSQQWVPPGQTPNVAPNWPPPAQPGPQPGQQAGWPQTGWPQPTASQYGQDLGQHEQAYARMYGEKPRTGMAIAAMVLGILAILGSWAPLGSYVSILLALLAIVFGIIGVRRQVGRGMAITGLVLGGIALVVSIVASIYWTRAAIDLVDTVTECQQETGRSSGRAFDQCVEDRSGSYSPFG